MNKYEEALYYIKQHGGGKIVIDKFEQNIQWHKDNAVPFDYMDLAHYALQEYHL